MSTYDKTAWGREIPYTSPTGVETTLYNIGTVAEAIGRTSQTIRKWEVAGIIPETPFKQNGKRLYSKEHIDAVVECAEKAHLTQGKNISTTSFSSKLYEEFKRINNLMFNVEETEDES